MLSTLSLPYELLNQIASDEGLSHDDWAAMRLSCRFFKDVATPMLFRRVIISRLKADRDTLRQIATSKHLACHVRELVWFELDLEAWVPQPAEFDTHHRRRWFVPGDDFAEIRGLMIDAIQDVDYFWFPRMDSVSDREEFVKESLGWFVATLHKFPHLTTLVSCPMPQDRVFTYKEYPISPDTYRNQFFGDSRNINSALFSYFLEAMKQPESTIRRLSWQGEYAPTIASVGNQLLPRHTAAFESLTTIDFRPSGFAHEECDMLSQCLAAAKNLEHLTLCFDSFPVRSDVINCILLAISKTCDWPRLKSLQISNFGFQSSEMNNLLTKCPNLRSLVFRECPFWYADVLELRKIPLNHLTSVAISGGDDVRFNYVSEINLLDFINGTSHELFDEDGEYMFDSDYFSIHVGPPFDKQPSFTKFTNIDIGPGVLEWEKEKGRYFRLGDGTVLYDDPLEYLSDWDSDDSDISSIDEPETHMSDSSFITPRENIMFHR